MENLEIGLPKFKIGASKRKLIKIYNHSIYYDHNTYNNIQEFQEILESNFKQIQNRYIDTDEKSDHHPRYKPTEYKFYLNTEYDGGSIEFVLELYRAEVDEEVEKRIKLEERLKKARENASIKRRAALEVKRKKQEELEKDPNYQELQKLKAMKEALEKQLGIKTRKKK